MERGWSLMVPQSPDPVGRAPRSTAEPVAMIQVAVHRLPEVTDAVVMPMVAAGTARADNVAPVRHDCGSAPSAHLSGVCHTGPQGPSAGCRDSMEWAPGPERYIATESLRRAMTKSWRKIMSGCRSI